MQLRDERPAGAAPSGGRVRRTFRRLAVWLRFHVASLAATLVDFGSMIAAVQLGGASPVVGTVLGASAGAITNFLLGRFWTYRSEEAPLLGQAFRYALVSGGSLLLNATGEYLLAVRLGLGYVGARVVVAVVVSNLWNFPLQSLVVFRHKGPRPPHAAPPEPEPDSDPASPASPAPTSHDASS